MEGQKRGRERGYIPHLGRGGPDQGLEVAMKKQDRFGCYVRGWVGETP